MRWVVKQAPSLGELRQRSGFLWTPMTLDKQVRWLEFATWEEQFQYNGRIVKVKVNGKIEEKTQEIHFWEPVHWISK